MAIDARIDHVVGKDQDDGMVFWSIVSIIDISEPDQGVQTGDQDRIWTDEVCCDLGMCD